MDGRKDRTLSTTANLNNLPGILLPTTFATRATIVSHLLSSVAQEWAYDQYVMTDELHLSYIEKTTP